MQVLLDSKKEYTEHLLDLITVPLTKRIFKIYDGCSNTSNNIKNFQQELINIKQWNNNKIQEEYQELIKKIKCKYFDKLLKKIVILDVNIKTDSKYKIKDLVMISSYDFIHKCLVNISIYCWKNVYLFSGKNLKPSEKQYHINVIEKNIRTIIKNTLRAIIPYETILDKSDDIKESKTKTKKEIKNDSSDSEEVNESDSYQEESDSEEESEVRSEEEQIEESEVRSEVRSDSEEESEENIKKTFESLLEPIKEPIKDDVKVIEIDNYYQDPLLKKKKDKLKFKNDNDEDEYEDINDTEIKKKQKKKIEEFQRYPSSDSSNESSDDNSLNETKKKININTIKRNRYYS